MPHVKAPHFYKDEPRTFWERLFSLTPWRATRKVRDYEKESDWARAEHESWVRTHRLRREGVAKRAAASKVSEPVETRTPTFHQNTADSAETLLNFRSLQSEPQGYEAAPAPEVFKAGGGGEYGGAGAGDSWEPKACNSDRYTSSDSPRSTDTAAACNSDTDSGGDGGSDGGGGGGGGSD